MATQPLRILYPAAKSAGLALVVGLSSLYAPKCLAQVVQLPTVRNFSYSGSALVPDGGTMSLGGVSRSATGRVNRGGVAPLSSAARGGRLGGSSLTASVQIIDLRALDEAILSSNAVIDRKDPPPLSLDSPGGDQGRAFLGGLDKAPYSGITRAHADPGAWQRALGGVVSEQPGTHSTLAEADVRFYLARGKQAEQVNRLSSARVYYRMAIEAMTPDMVERYHAVVERRKQEAAARAEAEKSRTGVKSF